MVFRGAVFVVKFVGLRVGDLKDLEGGGGLMCLQINVALMSPQFSSYIKNQHLI